MDDEEQKQLSQLEKRLAKKATEAGLARARQSKELKEAATIPQQVAGSTYIAGIQRVPDDVSAKRTALTDAIDKHASDPQYAHPTLGSMSRMQVAADKNELGRILIEYGARLL